MKVREVDILMLPGIGNADPKHWQSRWEAKLSTARRVEQPDWDVPVRETWAANVCAAIAAATRPVVVVAHALGVLALVHAAPRLAKDSVRGAFLVAPPDIERDRVHTIASDFGETPRDPLDFPSLLVASRTDPYCDYEVAADLGNAWGSLVIDAGEAGHLNTASGHGPWPEGGLTFARFVARL